ncbi:Enoyl-CoA hydratase/isomerase [Gracilaria domingensis]|nr:Enoyl-CoA hydratase/isomerase [Gracilaria domingensis]
MKLDPSLLSTGGLTYVLRRIASGETIHHITLVREKSLNALLPATFIALNAVIDCVKSPSYVLLTGSGRAFSAGGDVRALREKVMSAGPIQSHERRGAAWETLNREYRFMERMASLQGSGVVTVALADGYAFGAGQGLFQSCSVRLVTSKALFSMPEVAIGLVPDCGATQFYAKMPGCVGMYASLTGTRIGPADALALGLADGVIDAQWTGANLVGVSRDAVLSKVQQSLDGVTDLSNPESEMRRVIDDVFSHGSVKEIIQHLESKDDDWARQTLAAMKKGSPRALHECFRIMKEGYKEGGLRNALERELVAEVDLASRSDFIEGVRAVLVDKTGNPEWEVFDPTQVSAV